MTTVSSTTWLDMCPQCGSVTRYISRYKKRTNIITQHYDRATERRWIDVGGL